MKSRLLYIAEVTLETILFYIDLVYKWISYVMKLIRGIRYADYEKNGVFALIVYRNGETRYERLQ